MNYTKGDWVANPSGEQPAITIDGNRQWWIVNQVGGPTKKEAKANCALLAAAPDLYEACKSEQEWTHIWQLLNAFASGKTQDQFARVEPLAVLGDVYQGLAIIFQRQKAAIAKAERKIK